MKRPYWLWLAPKELRRIYQMAMSSTETAINISRKKRFSFGALTIVLITAVLFAFLTFTSDTFFTYRNIYAIFYGVSFQFIAVIGFTYLMIIGEIDLSVGSVYAFSGMFMGYLMVMKDVPLLPAMGLSLLACVVMCASPWMGRSLTRDWMVSE